MDHVAIQPDRKSSWGFVVPSSATTCREETAEMTSICSTIWALFGNFVIPTSLSFKVLLCPKDQPIHSADAREDSIEVLEHDISSASGIPFEDFESAMHTNHSGDRWVPRVLLDGARVKVHLEDGDMFASKSEHCVTYHKGSPLDRAPNYDPVSIRIIHVENKDEQDLDSEYIFYAYVELWSDIWFEDSPIGDRNRSYLSSFFEAIEKNLSVVKIRRRSDWYSTGELNAIF